jgi:hypothetical protein
MRRDSVAIVAVDGEFVVAPPDVLNQGVAGGHNDDRPVPAQAPHRLSRALRPGVIGFDSAIGVLGDVTGVG